MTDTLYSKITEMLVPVLPNNWEKVHLYSHITEDVYEFFFYVLVNDKYIQCFDLENEDDILNVFDELNDLMLPDWKEKKWSTCTFSLDNNGHVNVDYDYSELPEDIISYKENWEKKYLI